MAEIDIIDIANDRETIRDYAVIDPNAINTGIIRP